MDNTQKLRIKTAMIVYELELSLGKYVVDNATEISDAATKNIVEREKIRGNIIEKNNIGLVIEASYLDEIFNFAIFVTEGTSLSTSMIELKKLCEILGIFNIRNAVSHPNRPFPDSYWFRAAAIASDPLIGKLNLHTVRKALISAIEENLNAPPDEWLYNVNWAVPNTLPTTFDHEITGLLGRDKEFKDLETVLSKERNNLIAIVAPGGIGKTALILQFLKDLSLSPIWSSKLSAIVFCTLKNERLTANGVETIDTINGIDQVKSTLLEHLKALYSKQNISTFESALSILSEEKVLICVDNLETLLVDSHKEFIEFNESLPLKWRVLVTSRISIDSATTVSIEPLVRRHAINLSRNYLKKRGIVDFKPEDLEKIADASNNNPLAIRLTIDLYVKGGDISSSINKSQKEIASFSYKNLIESLKLNSISILEAIYVIGRSTKSDLIDFLELSNDDISESINELAKTSLIVRSSDEFGNDSFALSESIRDLLLTNPKNIEVRNRISEDLRRRKAKIQEQTNRIKLLGLTEFDEEYVPEGTDISLYSLITDLNKYLSRSNRAPNHSELILLKEKFSEIIRYRQNEALVFYNYSRIFRELKDNTNELSHLLAAQTLNADSSRIELAIALRYFYNSDYSDALKHFKSLKTKGFDNPLISTKKFGFTICKLHFLCLLYLGELDEILHLTDKWQNQEHWKEISGVYRASALKRKMEFQSSVDTNTIIISEILEIFSVIFENENYIDTACVEANKIIKDMTSFLSLAQYSDEVKSDFTLFIANHYFNIITKLRNESISSFENQKFLEKVYALETSQNYLHQVKWYLSKESIVQYDKDHIEELVTDGFYIVTVYHIPPDKGHGMLNYMFAEDSNKNQFYLSVSYFEAGLSRWGYIKEGSKLAIKYDLTQNNGKTIQATEIVEIDQY